MVFYDQITESVLHITPRKIKPKKKLAPPVKLLAHWNLFMIYQSNQRCVHD